MPQKQQKVPSISKKVSPFSKKCKGIKAKGHRTSTCEYKYDDNIFAKVYWAIFLTALLFINL